MSLYEQFATDKSFEKQGIVLEYGTNKDGKPIRIRIARAGGSNQKFAKVLERETKPYRRQLQNETLDEEIGTAVQRRVYARAVILGWENVEDLNGQPLAFNEENIIKLLTDLPDLFADIREQASKSALFRAEALEVESKNSERSSSTP